MKKSFAVSQVVQVVSEAQSRHPVNEQLSQTELPFKKKSAAVLQVRQTVKLEQSRHWFNEHC